MPTLADLVDAWRRPQGIDGISIVPTLLGEGEQPEHEGIYWEYARSGGLTRAARMGRWKAVQAAPNGAVELYDLEAVPGSIFPGQRVTNGMRSPPS